MDSKIIINQVNNNEFKKLQEISIQTFSETFAEFNSEENTQKYLKEAFNEKKLNVELNNPNSSFFFAKTNHQIVGYLKINIGNSQTERKDSKSLEIERIYVLKDFQGKQIGQKLFEVALEVGKKLMVEYIWLGVWEKNPKAIRFYKKNGFVEFDKHIFQFGDDKQTDIMMKVLLNYNQ